MRMRLMIAAATVGIALVTAAPAGAQETEESTQADRERSEKSSDSAEGETESEVSGGEDERSEEESSTEESDVSEDESETSKASDEESSAAQDESEPRRGESGDNTAQSDAEGDERDLPAEAYDPAWALYREAFTALAADDRQTAIEKLNAVRDKYPDHPAALFAEPVLAELGASTESADDTKEKTARTSDGDPYRKEPSQAARAELITFQTGHGILTGAELCIVARCGSVRAIVASLLLSGGVGFGASMLLSPERMPQGHALSLNSGTTWGFANAALLNSMTDNWVTGGVGAVWLLILGQMTGTLVGEGAWRVFHPTSGDVAMYNSGAFWGGALTALFLATFDATLGGPAGYFGTLLATSQLGGVAGGVASKYFPTTRARVHVVNAGGLVGGLVGLGTAVFIGGSSTTSNVATAASTLGIVGGLGATAYLTRGWDDEIVDTKASLVPSLRVRPTARGEGGVVSVGGQF